MAISPRHVVLLVAAVVALSSAGANGKHHPHHHPHGGKKWCVPKHDVADVLLREIMDYVCNQHPHCCKETEPGGACFVSDDAKSHDTVRAHAAFIMNYYFQAQGGSDGDCDFFGSGMITAVDPSTPSCKFNSP